MRPTEHDSGATPNNAIRGAGSTSSFRCRSASSTSISTSPQPSTAASSIPSPSLLCWSGKASAQCRALVLLLDPLRFLPFLILFSSFAFYLWGSEYLSSLFPAAPHVAIPRSHAARHESAGFAVLSSLQLFRTHRPVFAAVAAFLELGESSSGMSAVVSCGFR
jgi:hypothetical protein